MDLEEFDVGVVPNPGVHVPQINHAPHVSTKPHGRPGIGLVFPNENGVRHGEKAHQRTMLEKFQDFTLIRQT